MFYGTWMKFPRALTNEDLEIRAGPVTSYQRLVELDELDKRAEQPRASSSEEFQEIKKSLSSEVEASPHHAIHSVVLPDNQEVLITKSMMNLISSFQKWNLPLGLLHVPFHPSKTWR